VIVLMHDSQECSAGGVDGDGDGHDDKNRQADRRWRQEITDRTGNGQISSLCPTYCPAHSCQLMASCACRQGFWQTCDRPVECRGPLTPATSHSPQRR
jgi:hypothetical protein